MVDRGATELAKEELAVPREALNCGASNQGAANRSAAIFDRFKKENIEWSGLGEPAYRDGS
jgi:hypothetical protein